MIFGRTDYEVGQLKAVQGAFNKMCCKNLGRIAKSRKETLVECQLRQIKVKMEAGLVVEQKLQHKNQNLSLSLNLNLNKNQNQNKSLKRLNPKARLKLSRRLR